MNPLVAKYGPPLAVLGAAAYLGWPQSKPLDLGEEAVRAKAVRWSSSELDPPETPSLDVNPFRPVLVVEEAEQQTEELVQALPTPALIQKLVTLSGIASMNGKKIAFIGAKGHREGATFQIDHKQFQQCELVSIRSSHIVVQCRGVQVQVRPQVSRPETNYRPQPVAQPVSTNPDASIGIPESPGTPTEPTVPPTA